MEETTLIDSNGDELIFEYSWTGHLNIDTFLYTYTFSPEEVEKLRKLLNSFEGNNND